MTETATETQPRPGSCGARLRGGAREGFCRRPAGWGTSHLGAGNCKLHAGSTPNGVKAARVELLRQAARRLGIPREVEPGQALLELVWEAAGNVEFYRDLVASLEGGESGEGDAARSGLYGALRHQTGFETGEAKRHVLVQMYDDERDRLKEYAATVVKVGLAERQVQVAELQAALVARVVMGLLDDPELGLSREQRDVGRRLAGRHMRVLSAAEVEVAT